MTKNKVNLILYIFMGCLALTVIVLAIKLAGRPKPKKTVTDDKKQEQSVDPGKQDTSADENANTPEDMEGQGDENDGGDNTDVDVVPEEPKQVVMLRDPGENVNIRSTPDSSSKKTILGQIEGNDQYEYVGEYNDKWIIILYNGEEAYVSSKYVKVVEITEE